MGTSDLRPAPTPTAARGRAGRRPGGSLLGVVPFFGFVGVFLIIPTLVVTIGAFIGDDGGATLGNLSALADRYVLDGFLRSVVLSAVTARCWPMRWSPPHPVVRCAGWSARGVRCWPSSAASRWHSRSSPQ
jgi:hypothetical protein